MTKGAVVLIAVAGAAAAQSEYFPLHVGNQWIYRGDNNDVRAMEVIRTATFDGRQYAQLGGWFSGDAWLRMGEDGTLYAYHPETKREAPWVAFATPEGGSFDTELDPCTRRGVVSSTSRTWSGPAGDFAGAFEVRYPPANCADAGLEREVYGKWVGLIHRSYITIAGPRRYSLIYARIGGVTVLSEKEVTFSLTLDQAVYSTPLMTARLTLRHTQAEPLELVFSSGQTYEIVIRDDQGTVVWRWSDGKAFTEALRRELIPAGERNWVELIRLERVAAGRYTVEAWLTLAGSRAYSATVGFEIK